MADELLQEIETDDLARYYNQLCNQQVMIECERLWRTAALLLFQMESSIPSTEKVCAIIPPIERVCAIVMARKAVDSPYMVDSTVGDVRILARQFLRAIELAPGVASHD